MTVFAEFTVPASEFAPGRYLPPDADVRAELERLVPSGSPLEYVWFVGTGRAAVLDVLADRPEVTEARVVDELPDRTLVRLSWDGEDPVLRSIAAVDGVLLDAEGDAREWRLRLRFPDRAELRTFYERCAGEGSEVALEQVNAYDPGPDDRFDLSTTQRETVVTAFERGYFEVPRGTTLGELAEVLGVSDQAVSERLRRGLAALLRTTLREDDPATTGRQVPGRDVGDGVAGRAGRDAPGDQYPGVGRDVLGAGDADHRNDDGRPEE